jgi:hypothetical protein
MNLTFNELYESYWNKHAQIRLKCPANVHYFWKAHGAHWLPSDPSLVTTYDVQDWFDDLASRSRSSAVRAVAQLSSMYNWAIRPAHPDVR